MRAGGIEYPEAMCTIVLLSEPSLSFAKSQKRGISSASEQSGDPSLFGKPYTSGGARRREGGNHTKVKKDKKPPPVEGASMKDWFVDIGLGEQESQLRGSL